MVDSQENSTQRPVNRQRDSGWVLRHQLIRPDQSERLALLAEREDVSQASLIRKGIDLVLEKMLGKSSD